MTRKFVFIAVLAVASVSFAGTKSYQVTGPVVDVSDTQITVEKGTDKKEKWEIRRTPQTKAPAAIKKGDKVTIYYTMSADEIEAKAAAPAKSKKK